MGNDIEQASEFARLSGEFAAANAEVARLARESDVDPSGLSPTERRDFLNAKRAELDTAVAAAQRASEAMEAAMRREIERAEQALAPLQERAALLMDGVEAINLYLGTGEQITLLREGEPAPKDSPVVVYQRVLFMDEEMALAAEVMGLADATIDPGQKGWADFDAWLLADDAHVRQVCPARGEA